MINIHSIKDHIDPVEQAIKIGKAETISRHIRLFQGRKDCQTALKLIKKDGRTFCIRERNK